MKIARSFENPPKSGARGWISRVPPRHLPEGLGNRWPVEILAVGPEWCAVETVDGRRWIIGTGNIDFGWRFDVAGNGSRTPERHPAVLNYLEARLQQLREEAKLPAKSAPYLSEISLVKWILQRNGRQPPEADDVEQRWREAREDEPHQGPPPPEPRWRGPDPDCVTDDSPL